MLLDFLLAAVFIIVAVPAFWMLFYAGVALLEWWQGRSRA